MKYIFVILLLVSLSGCEHSDRQFYIEGSVQGLPSGTAVLQRRVGGKFITLDSVEVREGRFKMHGSLLKPEMCYIWLNDTLPFIKLFLENASIDLQASIEDLHHPVISGSNSQQILDTYYSSMAPFDNQMNDIYEEYARAVRENNAEAIENCENQFDMVRLEQQEAALHFVSENSDNAVGPYLVWGTLAYDLNDRDLENLSKKFSPSVESSIYVRQLEKYIENARKVSIGRSFTDIIEPDTTGTTRQLSTLRGHIILLDFWASWCRPCRIENPALVTLYRDYKDQGFEIFGVSLDDDRNLWKKAIRQDRMAWVHVSDLNGWDNTAVENYSVRAIPHTVLIDDRGIIIAKNLAADDLRTKIQSLLDQ